jgi:hypothetical protein
MNVVMTALFPNRSAGCKAGLADGNLLR